EGDDLVVVDEPPGEGRRDEAGPAGDEDPLPVQGPAASLPRKCFPTLSRGFTGGGYRLARAEDPARRRAACGSRRRRFGRRGRPDPAASRGSAPDVVAGRKRDRLPQRP